MLIRFFSLVVFTLLLTVNSLAAQGGDSDKLQDVAVRESLFSAFQGDWFAAISRLDSDLSLHEQLRKSPSRTFSRAETSYLGFQLSYRLNNRDDRLVQDTIARNSDDQTRNTLLYQLSGLHFRKGEMSSAQKTFDRIKGKIAPSIVNDLDFFKTQLLIAKGHFAEAVPILEALGKEQRYLGFAGFNKNTQSLLGFAGYNLGIAHLLKGDREEGLRQLDLAGQITGRDDDTTLAVRDKANLAHGEELFKAGQYELAGTILDRVRIEGPFSSRALLTAGWTSAMVDDYKRALVPWTLLTERNVADSAVQEALLAVPYCYGKLGAYTKAAILYGQAVETFEAEIGKLTRSIDNVQKGRFLAALVQAEMKYDPDWIVRMREHPEMPETYYLLDLMTSNDFQEAIDNYTDLEQLRKKLIGWQQDLLAYEDILEMRRNYYKPRLPEIDAEFKSLASSKQQLLKQRNVIKKKLEVIQEKARPMMMATMEERKVLNAIKDVDNLLRPYHTVKTKGRIKRLRGVTKWPIFTSFDQRVESTHANLRHLDETVSVFEAKYSRFEFLRGATNESFLGYDRQIKGLNQRISSILEQTEAVMTEQGAMLDNMVEAELAYRLEKLKEMQVKARFAMADSFDRAATSQGAKGGVQ